MSIESDESKQQDNADNTDINLFDKIKVSIKNDFDIIRCIKSWKQVVGVGLLLSLGTFKSWVMWSSLVKITQIIINGGV